MRTRSWATNSPLLVLAFLLQWGVLLLGMAAVRNGHLGNEILFWVLLASSSGTILLQIFRLRGTASSIAGDGASAGFIVLQILLLLLAFRFVMEPMTPVLAGLDANFEYATAVRVKVVGWPIPGLTFVTGVGSPPFAYPASFPMPHLFLVMASTLTGSDLLNAAKWFPPLYTIPSVLFVYLLAMRISRSRFGASFSAFMFAFAYMFLFFHSLFVREGMAYVFLLGALYGLATLRGSDSIAWRMLTGLFAFATILTHHLTPALLIGFLLVWLVIDFGRYLLSRPVGGMGLRGWANQNGPALVLALSLMLGVGAYWHEFQGGPNTAITSVLKRTFARVAGRTTVTRTRGAATADATSQGTSTADVPIDLAQCWAPLDALSAAGAESKSIAFREAPHPTPVLSPTSGLLRSHVLPVLEDPRTRVLLLGELSLAGLLGVVAVVGLIEFRELQTSFLLALLGYSAVLAVGVFITFTGLFLLTGSTALATRFELFGFLPLLLVAGVIAGRTRYGWALLILAFAWFMLNAYRAAPYVYANWRVPTTVEELNATYVFLPSEVAAARWLPTSRRFGTDWWLQAAFEALTAIDDVGLTHRYGGRNVVDALVGQRDVGGYLRSRGYRYFAVGLRGCVELGQEQYSQLPNLMPLSLIYENGSTKIFIVR